MMTINNIVKDFQEKITFWPHLTQEQQKLVLARISIIRYRSGQNIRGANSECSGFIYLIKGMFRAYLLSPDGREITLYRVRSGESCIMTATCVLDAVSFDTQVDAEEDCEALLIPSDVYSALIKNNVYVERDSYKLSAERFSDVIAGIERLVFLSLEQRLVSFILDEANENKSNELHITHEQLAINIGSAREAVSRTLKSLSSQGLLEMSRGSIKIKNKSALYKLIS